MKLIRKNFFSTLFSFGALSLAACDATIGNGSKEGELGPSLDEQQQAALVNLQGLAGGPIRLELSEQGGVRVRKPRQRNGALRAFGFRELAGFGNLFRLAGDHELAGAIQIREHHAGLGADFTRGRFVEADDRGHAALGYIARFLHELAALAHDA